jgi:hypothetical protein
MLKLRILKTGKLKNYETLHSRSKRGERFLPGRYGF